MYIRVTAKTTKNAAVSATTTVQLATFALLNVSDF